MKLLALVLSVVIAIACPFWLGRLVAVVLIVQIMLLAGYERGAR